MSIFTRDMSVEALKGANEILRIPEGITELDGDFALVFDDWKWTEGYYHPFREIVIPKSVEKINGIFVTGYGSDTAPVKKFKKITVDKDNQYYADIDGVLFSKDLKRLICYPCGKPGKTYNVPDSVEVIDEGAFDNNVFLRTINFPSSVKRIGFHAFFQCDNLVSLNFPDELEYIGEECFSLSSNINRLIIPQGVKKVFTSLFYDGGVVVLPNKELELEYDFVPTEYLRMPFLGPAIVSNGNDVLEDFAETYDYNHFENYTEDEHGIIWANQRTTLVSFPPEWSSRHYVLPDVVEEVYVNAFTGCSLKSFSSSHNVTIVGKTNDNPKCYEQSCSRHFYVNSGCICIDDKEQKPLDRQIISTTQEILEMNNRGYVFISYSSKNQQVADSVRMTLIENKIPCWMAPYDIPAGSQYAGVINDALENCSCLLLLLTNASQSSQFVERELERAITYRKPIVPMQLENLELNSGFKFYIGSSQIIAVPDIRADTPEFKKVISSIHGFICSTSSENPED